MKRSRTLLFNPSSPLFLATLIGGNTPTSSLTLQSTSGVGTTDSILFKVGNNGSGTVLQLNDGPGAVGGGAIIGSYNAAIGAIWSNAVTPATGNYSIALGANTTGLNAATGKVVSLSINDGSANQEIDFNGATLLPAAASTIALGSTVKPWSNVVTTTIGFGTQTTSTITNVNGFAGYIPITDAAGVARKVAILT